MQFYAEHARVLREEAGLTQEDAASACGVTAQAVGCWERGENKPLPGNVRKLAKLYRCTVADLSDIQPSKRHDAQIERETAGSTWMPRELSQALELLPKMTPAQQRMAAKAFLAMVAGMIARG